jgi:hypothetical protein
MFGRQHGEMTPEARAFFHSKLAGKRPYHVARLLATTVEKNCERCGKWFLAGGDYNPTSTGTWRKRGQARFCSKFCSARSYSPTRYKLDPATAPIMSPSMLDIAWAAGIYEGEGSVHNTGGFKVAVAQKDPWLLRRLAQLFGGRVRERKPDSGRLGSGTQHYWVVGGARARGVAYTFYSFLSPRRRAQIRAALGVA